QPRMPSPPAGFSTLTTSAPRSASSEPAKGPAAICPNSRTRMPASGPWLLPLPDPLMPARRPGMLPNASPPAANACRAYSAACAFGQLLLAQQIDEDLAGTSQRQVGLEEHLGIALVGIGEHLLLLLQRPFVFRGDRREHLGDPLGGRFVRVAVRH